MGKVAKFREISSYLIFGVFTTLINIFVFFIFNNLLSFNYLIANVFAWFLSVLFAYITNRRYVFKGHKMNTIKTMFTFFLSRLTTLGLDMFLMFIMIDTLSLKEMYAKITIQVVVVILNYVFSKMFVFNSRD